MHSSSFLCLSLSLTLRKAAVKWCVCTFPLGNASSWTRYRQSVHSVPVDGTQSSCCSCLFWKLGGGQRCQGVPRSVAALTICRMNKGGNKRTSEFPLGSRYIDAHCTSEAEEIINTLWGFAVTATWKGLKLLLVCCVCKKISSIRQTVFCDMLEG